MRVRPHHHLRWTLRGRGDQESRSGEERAAPSLWTLGSRCAADHEDFFFSLQAEWTAAARSAGGSCHVGAGGYEAAAFMDVTTFHGVFHAVLNQVRSGEVDWHFVCLPVIAGVT